MFFKPGHQETVFNEKLYLWAHSFQNKNHSKNFKAPLTSLEIQVLSKFFVGMLLLGGVNFGMSVSPFRPTDFLPTSS